MITQFDSLIALTEAFPNEQSAIDHFTSIRWANGEFCPYCGHDTIYHFSDKRTHKCGQCRQRFSIKVGTIFEDTKIPLRKWFMAIWLITSHRKGVASAQLARDIKVTQKTAWFMLHRLRHAARTRSFNRPLDGEIEIDETFVGGKDKNRHADKRQGKRGGVGKVMVFGMLERGGEFRAFPVDQLTANKAHTIIGSNVKRGAAIMTDDAPIYRELGYWYRHEILSHVRGEYGRGKAHTNSIEGAWALLKRQIIGIHHWISEKHVARYVAEAVWRYNRRHIQDGPRMNEFLTRVDGPPDLSRLDWQGLTLDKQLSVNHQFTNYLRYLRRDWNESRGSALLILRCATTGVSPMETTGGAIYHDAGFAGLRESLHPVAGLVDQQVNGSADREREIPNAVDKPVVQRPLGVPGPLLFK